MSEFLLITPLLSLVDETLAPQPDLIKAHMNWLKERRVDGVLVMGTTGEFANFSVSQRQRYLETVVDANPGLDVMVNIGAASSADVLALQAHALTCSAVKSMLWMPPFYFPDSELNGMDRLLSLILDRQPDRMPFYLYHYPKMSQVSITPELLTLSPRVTGMKDTSGDFARIEAMIKQCPDKQIFVGTDYQIQESIRIGATGIISGMSNLFPHLSKGAIEGDMTCQEKLKAARDVLTRHPKMPSMKAYLNYLKLSGETTVSTLPFADLDTETAREIVDALVQIDSEVLTHAH